MNVNAQEPDHWLQYNVIEETEREIYDGVKHIHATAEMQNDAFQKSTQNVNVIIKDVDAKNVQVVSWAKIVNGRWRLAPLDELARDFEAKNPGWKVIAGVNGDFFTTPPQSINMHMNPYGDILKPMNRYLSVGIKDDGSYIQDIRKPNYGDYYITIYDPDTYEILLAKEVEFNADTLGQRSTTVFYNKGDHDIPNTMKFFVETPEVLTFIDNQLFAKGTVSPKGINRVYTDDTNFALVTNDPEVFQLLEEGHIVRVQKLIHSEVYRFNAVIGGDSTIIRDGRVLTQHEMDRGGTHATARHPRTTIGITADGSLMLGTIDGRQHLGEAGVVSNGVSFRELARMMYHYGAVLAFNLDGGGSTQMIVRNDRGDFDYVNSPSEGPHINPSQSYRSDGNGILLVVPDVSVITNYENLGFRSLDLSYSIHPTDDVEVQKVELSINGEKSEITDTENTLHLDKLNDGLNFFNFIVTYKKNGKVYTRSYAHKIFDLSLDAGNRLPEAPEFNVKFKHDEESNDLTLTLHYTGNETEIKTLKMKYGEEEDQIVELTIDEENTATLTLSELKPGEYTFEIIFVDQFDNERIHEETYTFIIEGEDEDPNDDDPNDEDPKDEDPDDKDPNDEDPKDKEPKEKDKDDKKLSPVVIYSIVSVVLVAIIGTVVFVVIRKRK